MSPSLEHLVKEWLKLDTNPITKADIQKLWDQRDTTELEKRMRSRIEFGTAGLRGKMEAGWARMNDLIIIQASQGLCAYVLKHVSHAVSRGVVVGHDHRHNSERWARLTANVFIANNVKVYLHHGFVHTPLVPFSMIRLNAACGVMITASHNPKDDNGYKVYWENAIIAPHDVGIQEAILQNLDPMTGVDDTASGIASPLCIDCTDIVKESYFASIQSLVEISSHFSSVKFVNTSMHGVSDPFVTEAFKRAGLPPYIPVEKQQLPDPNFPTVKFPNPEEKGALDLAISTAIETGADYVLAQDPDSDRFSAAERGADGQWLTFTGDQLGSLFASHILDAYKVTGKPLSNLAMVASTVSSKMIEAMALIEGFMFVECLTGFKFIGNTALDLTKEGYEVPFGYEEAIGFMFGSEIRDKDGVAATVMFAGLVTKLREQGLTVKKYLEGLYERCEMDTILVSLTVLTGGPRYGYFETKNSYFVCSDPVIIDRIFWRLRHFNGSTSDSTVRYPASIAGFTVNSIIDLTTGHGYDSTNSPTYKPRLPLSSGHMIQFRARSEGDLNMSIVLTIRTSGTEPKIKYYLEGTSRAREKVSQVLDLVVKDLGEVWMKASELGLRNP